MTAAPVWVHHWSEEAEPRLPPLPLRRSRVEDIVLINVTTAALDHWTEAVEKALQNVALLAAVRH